MTAITDLSKLCIHTVTTKPWSIREAAKKFSAAGVAGITVWRDTLNGESLPEIKSLLGDYNLEVVSLCRGGFFPSLEMDKRQDAIDDNLRAIDEAHALGAPMVVLVCGADPRQPLADSRKQITEGIDACLTHAAAAGVKLAIEPLHPMYAGDRSAVNTIGQANEMAEALNSPWVGVAVDVYHLWWDPALEAGIKRCGEKGNLAAFHVCDWKTPTLDMLNDRGLMGEGCIDLKKIRSWVEATGFKGYHEVEIFSTIYWKTDQDQFLSSVVDAYLQHC
ncbi:MAG: sugar phosphate isomerase/epimerase [Chitinophagaceae bacterium]|nr:MAG: sugar phosphate isomerase/epimerase [Chitinophagaceae bacterium]